MGRHNALRTLARRKIAPKPDAFTSLIVRDLKFERRTGVPVPYLYRVDAVPMGALAAPAGNRSRSMQRGRPPPYPPRQVGEEK
jgi:hypothetical protein